MVENRDSKFFHISAMLPQVCLFTVGIFLLGYFMSDNFKGEREIIGEGLSAIAWHVSSPRCVVNDVCQYIEHDKSLGELLGVEKVNSAPIDSYTTLLAQEGRVTILGDALNLQVGTEVNVFREHNGIENVACLNTTCFSVPFLKND